MSEKKSEKDLLNDLAELERERRKIEKDFASDPFGFISTNWQFDTEKYAEELLSKRELREKAEKTLLENKKKLFEELGLEWDEDIVKWVEDDRLLFLQYYSHVPDTEVPEKFKKRAETLANYINKHTKLGKLL